MDFEKLISESASEDRLYWINLQKAYAPEPVAAPKAKVKPHWFDHFVFELLSPFILLAYLMFIHVL
jgi:hypothetical protein